MEKMSTLLKESSFPLNEKNVMKCHDFSCSSSCHDSQRIDFNDYQYLVEQLSKWRVFYPKAQIKKYGAKNCWLAMQRTKSMCPRVPGAYFTTTVRDIVAGDKKQLTSNCSQPATNCYQSVSNCNQLNEDVRNNRTTENHIVEVNKKVKQNLPVQSPTRRVKSKKGIFTPPNIINWREARAFLCNLTDNDLEDEEVLIFANKLKKQFNFA